MSSKNTVIRFATGVAVLSLAVSMASCAGSPEGGAGDNGPVTIKFLGHSSMQVAMEQIIADFESENPDITVEAQIVPGGPGYGQTLMTQIQGGNPSDVFYVNGGTGATESLLPLASAGRVLDLSEESWVDEMPEAAKPLYQLDGKTFGLLTDVTTEGIGIPLTTASEAAIEQPQTFDDLLDICARAKSEGKTAFAVAGLTGGIAAEIVAASVVYSADPDWNTKRLDGEVTFADSKEWQQTFEMVKQMNEDGCFPSGWETKATAEAIEPVIADQTWMTIGSNGLIGSLFRAIPGTTIDDYSVWPFPGETEADSSASFGFGNGLAVSANTPHKEEALKFLEYIAGEGSQTKADLSGTTSLGDFTSKTLPSQLSAFQPLFDEDRYTARAHDFWDGGSAYEAMSTAVVAAATGQVSVKDALQTVDDAWGDGS